MTAPRTTYSPTTYRRSASALLTTALGKVPEMFRSGVSLDVVEDHILVAALLADDLYAEAAGAA